MKNFKVLVTAFLFLSFFSVRGQDYQVGAGFGKTNNSIPVVYQVRNSGSEGSGLLMISGADTAAIVSKSGNVGIGTSTPTETLDVVGSAKISNADSSSFIFRGTEGFLLFGSLPVSISGSGAINRIGNWLFTNYTGADNFNNLVGTWNSSINLSTGQYRSLIVDSTYVGMASGNVLNDYGGITDDVSLAIGYNTNNAEWTFFDKTAHWAVKDSSSNDIVSIGEVNGLTYTDGSEGAGKVLTSDSNGNASWVNPSAEAARQSTARNDTATTGSSATIPSNISNYIIDTGGALAAYSLIFPADPVDGQVLYIIASSGTAIASLTVSSVSDTINLLTTALTSAAVRYVFVSANSTWYKS